ncbi:CYTH and CHAD domain-containing protein [Pigmentiphaga sp.]|uniref:CYTH and CHAD domain-containing protein n=1 Tax=Pigmentiphaga sp. TaxID=1977564 RepID=UPI00128C9664|nr:CYTH and CHAD domain-containing protein [Pigmentiphaga sp.]MPS28220.1 CYTH and CHAD domain-containing protein [Alcaligenaceae bacterium SAGV5]MPS28375.1 CYTH and CHAD domain-containing protein [Alcaligenaceae bacterium SAGV5]MPS51418.1 CYTH and CHAD domain-containing protein [Alcaligenaceae bacterium SAGV3]MPT55986.1 CYTH and CHAD domain-containing protein [Alcaligenaceae bacterium]
MVEQELKFSVPSAAHKAVAGQFASLSSAPRMHLRAMYFDTPDRQLARQRAAIRLRQEGRTWVQTFKMAGADVMSRVELNHPSPGRALDLSVYAGTPAEAVLAGLTAELVVRYETDVWRRAVAVRTRAGTVEAAYDVGTIRAQGLELPVCELEFELVSGRPQALFIVAGRWLARHGLVLDLRSKAERGDGLANAAARIAAAPLDERPQVREAEIAAFWGPRFAAGIELGQDEAPDRALAAMTAECFEQIARNAAPLAAADAPPGVRLGGAEHVHQLRVGMRRLRSAWKLLDGNAELPPAGLRDGARRHFSDFGRVRDQDVMGGAVLSALVDAGMPPLQWQPEAGTDAATLAASVDFQSWLLGLLAWNVGIREPAPGLPMAGGLPSAEPAAAPEPGRPVRLARAVTPRLRKWHGRLVRDGRHFVRLEDERRHALRKLAKRLRYGLALSAPLYRAARVRAYRKKLSALQDILGEINDLVVARTHYASLADAHSQAWFALGWIAARLRELEVQAEAAFGALAEARLPWKPRR